MKAFMMIVLAVTLIAAVVNWPTDFVKARERAKAEHKYILLSFSGSDWCVPCIKTKKEIFDKEPFSSFADSNLILVNADFPRLKKSSLSKAQVRENDALAEQYDKEGAFPLTLLLNADGKVIKEWKGYPNVTSQSFVDQIKSVEHYR
jgi:thioredoxin-related protein